LQALYRIGRTDISEFKLLTPSGENCFRFRLYTSLAVIAASLIAPVRFLMQMSARNAFGVRYVFDGRSHDRPAQRSSGLRMHLGPSRLTPQRPTAQAVSFFGTKRTCRGRLTMSAPE
jgi:hypothetical protein